MPATASPLLRATGARPRIALVVGSGSLKCAAAFGVAEVLQRNDIPIDLVVGCSGGAFCASWLAVGEVGVDHALRLLTEAWTGSFDKIDYLSLASAFFPRLFRFNGSAHLVKDDRINAAIRAYAGDKRIEDTAIPLHVIATDFHTGERVQLSRGLISDAIRASIALPLILAPWKLDGRRLVDGGVSDPLPVATAVEEGADIIIAVGFEDSLNSVFTSGLGMVQQLTSLLVNNLYRSQYAFYNLTHDAETIIIVPQFDREVGLTDVHLIPYLVDCGAKAAEMEIPYLQRLLSSWGANVPSTC